MSGINSYSGTTTVLDGQLVAGAASAFGSGPASVSSGTTLDLAGYDAYFASLAGGGTVTTSGGPATLTISGGAADAVFSGLLEDGANSGQLALDFSGGKETLTGANTYSGGTTIDSGATLVLGSANVLPSSTASSPLEVDGTLDLDGNNLTIGSLTGIQSTSCVPVSTFTYDSQPQLPCRHGGLVVFSHPAFTNSRL